MVIILGSASLVAAGGGFFLRDRLEAVPEGVDEDLVEVVEGRLQDARALRAGSDALEFPVAAKPERFFVEFWVRPADWRADGAETVRIAELRVGGTPVEIRKAAGRAMLEMVAQPSGEGEQVLAWYPISTWIPRKEYGRREEWHHVAIGTDAQGDLGFAVDGFPAHAAGRFAPRGGLTMVALGGSGESSDFSWLHGIAEEMPSGTALRDRYRSLFAGRPLLPKITVTAPEVAQSPAGDGGVDEAAWAGAARVVGFASNHRGRGDGTGAFAGSVYDGEWHGARGTLKHEPVTAYLAHDGERLFLGVRTPYEGTLRSQRHGVRDRPIYREEAYEIFLMPPWTGEPDYVQLVGNPHGDQADLRIMDGTWRGNWEWQAVLGEDVWSGELTAPFRGLQMPEPQAGEVWGMNLFNTGANAAWSPSGAHHNIDAFADVRFGAAGDPVVRPGHYRFEDGRLSAPIEMLGGAVPAKLTAELAVFRQGEVLPERTQTRTVDLAPEVREELKLSLPVEDIERGTLLVTVHDGETLLYAHHAGFPPAPPLHRGAPPQAPDAEEPAAAGAGEKTAEPASEPSEEEKAYARTWTAAELGEELLRQTEWWNNDLGKGDDVPAPWTPMEVEDQTVRCWGRDYIYRDSVLPAQIVSAGAELLAAPPRFVLRSGGETIVFEEARVEIERLSDAGTRVRTVAESGPWKLTLDAVYEFDGFAKIQFRLQSGDRDGTVDSLHLEIPMAGDHSKLFHYSASWSGHPPGTDAGAVPEEGVTLDAFREIVWLGDHRRGLAWIAEGMENWRIEDESAIQTVGEADDGARVLAVKLADRPFKVTEPWQLVFALQATPARPMPEDWRFRSDRRAVNWIWHWGDGGSYYPFHDNPGPARAQVEQSREQGREVMPASSQRFYSRFRNHKATLGELDHPGMMHREVLLWAPLWRQTSGVSPGPVRVPERHTATGNWYGTRGPGGLESFSAASPFQDYYLWRLNKTIGETGLGAIYLDQPMIRDDNPHNASGYLDYRGEWRPRSPLFASREMQKRMYRLFHGAHGRTHIKWHSSNQIVVPVISFTDIFWDGENYGHGTLKVNEFYSDTLSEDRMQAQHTGLPFGFAPSLLPTSHLRGAPPATLRDTLGYFLVHDSHVWNAHLANSRLISEITGHWLDFPFADSRQFYYWEEHPGIEVGPQDVLHILHVSDDEAMLILFNRSHQPVEATARLDAVPWLAADTAARDAETGESFPLHQHTLATPLAPKDFRILRLSAAYPAPNP